MFSSSSPAWVLLFIVCIAYTFWTIYKAIGTQIVPWIVIVAIFVIQGLASYLGFYLEWSGLPPRMVLLPVPSLILILLLYLHPKGRAWIDKMTLQNLMWIHPVRIPVEICLFGLASQKLVSPLMTFEGLNWDILSGLSAIPIIYLYFYQKKLTRKWLLWWNIVGLILLLNIVIIAILSAPTDLQKLSFDQPNIAIAYIPFIWLPSLVVPWVFFSHVAAIRQLIIR